MILALIVGIFSVGIFMAPVIIVGFAYMYWPVTVALFLIIACLWDLDWAERELMRREGKLPPPPDQSTAKQHAESVGARVAPAVVPAATARRTPRTAKAPATRRVTEQVKVNRPRRKKD
jgi:hypothetical protein